MGVTPDQVQALPESFFVRQRDILPLDILGNAHVTLIGAGAVGSMVAVNLVKMGLGALTVYDPDRVEAHNLPNQFYRVSDLGQPKVVALKYILEGFGAGRVVVHERLFAAQPVEGIVVSAVDSMDARLRIWKALKTSKRLTWYIDSRMGAEVGKILVVDPSDPTSVQSYETDHLYPTSEAFRAPCTAKATVYCSCGLASLVAAKVGKLLLGRPSKRELVIDFRNALLL